MKQLVSLTRIFLVSSIATEQPAVSMLGATVIPEAGLTCQAGSRHKPGPELVVTITPPAIKIPDNSKRGTPLAKITVAWSNGAPYHGKLKLTKNPGGICQLAGMEIQLARDTTKADDYITSVCTVTASK